MELEMSIQNKGEFDKLNMSRRKQLQQFLKEHGGEGAELVIYRNGTLASKKQDTGAILCLLWGRNPYSQGEWRLYVVSDTIRHDNRLKSGFEETFVYMSKTRDAIASMMGIEGNIPDVPKVTYDSKTQYLVSRVKTGRPKKTATAEEIYALREQGMTNKEIAAKLGISTRTLYRICQK